MRNLFITGTDTGVGKTWATLGLMTRLQGLGLAVNGMKPVASGSEWQAGRLRNADAILIRNQSSRLVEYELVNPYAFAEPIAPHIAADKQRVFVDIEAMDAAFCAIAEAVDMVVVEGVGGWRTPLSGRLQAEDLIKRLNLSVILVVGLRLGCINHALLTAEAILAAELSFAGWLGNCVCPDYPEAQATIDYLRKQIPAPFLGRIPYLYNFSLEEVGSAIETGRLVPAA